MLNERQSILQLLGSVTACVIILVMQNFTAGEAKADELTDRETVVIELAETWATYSNESVDSLLQTFRAATDEQLLEIENAKDLDEVRLILLDANSSDEIVLELGEIDKNFVYTPVEPCRIVDTRLTAAGSIPTEGTRSFDVHGFVSSQGGNPAGCSSPLGEPRAVHINVVAVRPTGNGTLRAFPYGIAPPTASLVNYTTNTTIANGATVQTCYICGPDITIQSRFASANVVIDVLGYYHEVKKITKYLSIPARGGFVPHRDDGSFANCFPNTFAWSGVGDSRFYAMVNLPQGAVVTRLTYHLWRSTAATSETRAELFRQPVPATTSRTAMATVISTSSDSGHTSRSDSSISNATIDNQNFTYYVEVNLPQAGQLCTDGVVIRYTDIP